VQTPPATSEPSRAHPASNTDEAGLWDLADRAEQQARQSGQLETDAALNAYVHDVACRVADGVCGDIRLYVLNRPFFNAAMAPNGYMEVWSGLLLRCDDEAQLAFVLGHEVGHYAERHTLLQWRNVRGQATAGLILSIVSAGVGAALIGDLLYLGALSSVFAYSRELENAADTIGFNRAVAAGYNPQAGVALWTSLIAETQASNDPEVRRKATRGSVFATHPLSTDRVAALRTLATQRGAGGDAFHERYRAAIRPFLDRWLRAELRRRDFGETLSLLDRLGAHSEDLGVVEFYRGEVYRLRREDGDRAQALAHYTAAIAQPDAPVGAWEQLGEFAQADGHNADAANYFTTYLTRAPNASDRALVQARVTQLTQGGAP
jgi:predicted Zn-dependent protease